MHSYVNVKMWVQMLQSLYRSQKGEIWNYLARDHETLINQYIVRILASGKCGLFNRLPEIPLLLRYRPVKPCS